MAFREISVEELKDNPFTLINKDWMLITAGNREKHNTMTASWGGVGELWGRYVSTIYIRPQRYTLEFVEREDYYSLCFFGPEYRQALNLCGSKSGREVDKDAATGLTPCFDEAAPSAASCTAKIWRKAASWTRAFWKSGTTTTCTACLLEKL